MSLHIPCPNCGADVVFRSAALTARVCDHCRTMLVRSDSGVAVAGVSAPLPFDVSPIQIGTRGQFAGDSFEVIGRVRWGWTDGSWNEWLLLFGNGDNAWLSDAMGQYMLQTERPFEQVQRSPLQAIAQGGDAVIGTEVLIDEEKLSIVDARPVICLAAEGELPFTPTPGWRVYSVDLRDGEGNCATLQRDNLGTDFYQGRYVTLAELKPANLRAIEGWAMPGYAAA